MAKKGYSFGTFQGVFVPSILTILGVIMYMRFGWVLGATGIVKTLMIVTIATSVTFLTSLSLAALVTNSPVGSGGAYYVISRSLGIEAGSAIGLPLYCAQTLGIAFYISGFAESLNLVFPSLNIKIIAVVTLLLITVLVFLSADIALKTQYLIFALIALSLVSFFLGNGDHLPPPPDNLVLKTFSFWAVFAVFFPAVTGIEAGLGMSGDLKNPARALTFGTMGAVLLSYVVYLAIPLFINHYVPNKAMLLSNNLIMADIARWRWAVLAGIWGATLSSAIGSLLTAPRTMQALSVDRIIPRFFGKGFGENNDPRVATVISFGIALAGILLGDLDLIAPVLSMFFLTSYGLINVSAAFEGIIGSPWWRPTFRTPWFISAIGATICIGSMFMINAGASFIAIFMSILFYFITRHRRLKAHWGDAKAGILMWLIQTAVYKLARKKPDGRTWRPNIIVFSGAPSSRWYLVSLADALSRGRGMMTIASIFSQALSDERSQQLRESITSYLDQRGVESLVKVYSSPSFSAGASTLLHAYGFGPLIPNTVLMGDPSEELTPESYLDVVLAAAQERRNLIIVKENSSEENSDEQAKGRRIDIWWDQESDNAGLLLAIGFLMGSSRHWHRSRLSVHTILTGSTSEKNISERIHSTVKKMRLGAEVKIHDNTPPRSHWDIITETSHDAAFVLLGMRSPLAYAATNADKPESGYKTYFDGIMDKVQLLHAAAVVMAHEQIDFESLFIE
jgi:solute carrier family 12 (sodium/potassium/chloride transporter), member 2